MKKPVEKPVDETILGSGSPSSEKPKEYNHWIFWANFSIFVLTAVLITFATAGFFSWGICLIPFAIFGLIVSAISMKMDLKGEFK